MLSTILSVLTDPKKRQWLLVAALVIAALLLVKSCNDTAALKDRAERDRLLAEQNERALTDQVRYEKNKAGDIESVRNTLVAEMDDLKRLNRDLYNESKKEIGTVRSLIKAQAAADMGKVDLSSELVSYPGDSTLHGLAFDTTVADSGATWKLRGISNFRLSNGLIHPGKTNILENSLRMKLVLGFKENDGNYEVFARAASPLVKIDSLSGVMIIPKKATLDCPPPPKKKRFGIGFYGGYGVVYADKRITFAPSIGVGLSYNIIRF